MMLPNSAMKPEQMLAQYGKSFNWAACFLNTKQLRAARQVYAFCRYIDDLVDETDDKMLAKEQLKYIKQAIETGCSEHVILTEMLRLIDAYAINKNIVLQLVDGVAWDLTKQQIDTEEELLRYSYGVASTVGLMMCPILSIKDPMAYRFAIDLGIAMQLTNIARDVLTDAQMDRIYLPQAWFAEPVTPMDILKHHTCRFTMYQQILRVLTLADEYYCSADFGLSYLPWRARASIIIASRVYQAIGKKIVKMGAENYWRKNKVYTYKREKVLLSIQAMQQLLTNGKYKAANNSRVHVSRLHEPIQDLIQHVV